MNPGLIEIDCRVTYARSENGAKGSEWLISPGAAVRCPADGPRIALGAPLADGGLIPLNFAASTAMDGPLTLAATVMIPVNGRTSFTIPLVQFAARRSNATAANLSSNQVGVTAGPGFRAVVSTSEPNLWHTTVADPAFRQDLHGAVRNEPEQIFDARQLSALPVELVPIVPSLKVRINHEAAFSTDRLAWTTTAEIRSENAPGLHARAACRPQAEHRLDLHRGGRGGTACARGRTGNTVTLFLRDRAAATQDSILNGSMPVELGKDMVLPEVSVVDATVTDARVLLTPDSRLDLTVVGQSPEAAGARLRDERSDERATVRSRELHLAPGASLPRVRVTRRTENPRVTSATVIRPRVSGMAEVTTYIQAMGTNHRGEPIEILIPREIASKATIGGGFQEPIRHYVDGAVGVVLQTASGNDPANLHVNWIQTPDGETWSVPFLRAANAETSESFLFLEGPLLWQPSRSSAVRPAESRAAGMDETAPSDHGKLSRLEIDRGRALELDARSTQLGPKTAATRAVLHASGTVARPSVLGSTFFLLDELDEPALRILWPKSAIVRAAFADGHRVTPIPAEDGQIAIPIRADGHKHRVAIHWSESTNSPLSMLGKVAEQIPVSAVHSAPTALLAVSVPPEFHLFVPAGFQELEPQAFANECDAIASAEAEPAADSESQWAESRSFNADAGRRMLGRITLKTPSPAIEFWAFRTALLSIPLAVSVFALVMIVLTRLVRWGAAACWLIGNRFGWR